MIIGHIPNSYVVHRLFRLEKRNLPLGYLLLGTLLPDLIDKSLQFTIGFPGRGVGHTMLLPLLAYLALFLIWQNRKRAVVAMLLGHLLHLLQDLVTPQLLFWPLWGDFYYYPGKAVSENLTEYYLSFTYLHLVIAELLSILLSLFYLNRESPLFKRFYAIKK